MIIKKPRTYTSGLFYNSVQGGDINGLYLSEDERRKDLYAFSNSALAESIEKAPR